MSPLLLLDQLFVHCQSLLPRRRDHHPLGCHRPRIGDRECFEALWFMCRDGLTYRRAEIAFGISRSTLMRRRQEWAPAFAKLERKILQEYIQGVRLSLCRLAGDSSSTKAPCGGEIAGPSPVDRAKGGTKLSQIVDGNGVPLAFVVSAANQPDCTLLQPLLARLLQVLGELPASAALYLDKGYDTKKCHALLAQHGIADRIVRKGKPYPKRKAVRWVVEATNSWQHNYLKLTRMTERTLRGASAFVSLANASITLAKLLTKRPRAAWSLPG